MKKTLFLSFPKLMTFFFLGMLMSANAFAQTASKPFVTVEGEVLKPLKLTLEHLLKLKQTEVKAKDRDGKEHIFKGVRLFDLLDSAGVTLGKELRGENLTKYVLIKAVDGYEVIFSLPEIDPEFTGQTILIAYQMDGNPLPKGEGPFRIVAPNDKKPARWIRELTTIKVVFSKE
ncbi:MAG: molybdopterin-dependent oxidoreductase [Chryseolinea sp.]